MKLILFFTRNVSLLDWLEKGLLDREKLIYEQHLQQGNLDRVYWITYGNRDAKIGKNLESTGQLHPKIDILPMPRIFNHKVGRTVYSFIAPLLYYRLLKTIPIIKTNQIDGSWSGWITKFLCRNSLIVRIGYLRTPSEKTQLKSKIKFTLWRLIENTGFRISDVGIVTTKKQKENLLKRCGLPDAKILIIPNYVDTSSFCDMQLTRSDRIVYVGRLSKEKNLFNLLTALSKTDYHLDLYGDGDLKNPLQSRAEKLGVKVQFKGAVPNSKLPSILNRYKYFILPSLTEGMPKALLEAMACGCLCIGTDVPGISGIIKHGENGLLAADVDSESISTILSTLHQVDFNKLRCEGMKTVHKNYSLKHVVDKEKALFQRLKTQKQ